MNVTVEFTGIAKVITTISLTTISVDIGTTYIGIIKLISDLYPGLKGVTVNSDGTELLNSNVLILNGDEIILQDKMNEIIDGDCRLTLLSIIVGGV